VKLPNVENARIDRTKILDYLLAVDHPEGAGKATFFLRFGFTIDDWQTFADALISHARLCHVTKLSESGFGTKYQIDGPLSCQMDVCQPYGRSGSLMSEQIFRD
jgi:hypothetical protein